MRKWLHSLFTQVDASSLAVLRIGFGALLVFLSINTIALCPTCVYFESEMLFKYRYFEWVAPLPGIGLYVHWGIMALCALAITFGYQYRLALFIFTCGFTYAFLLDQAIYLNHYYMVILFCVLMLFIPAHCKWSIDARRNEKIASKTVPRWAILVLILQLEIILIYAGIVKLNPDWLNLEPLRLWMQSLRGIYPPFFTDLTGNAGIALGAYGAIALHLLGAPLLFFRKTRPWVLVVYAIFHTINHTVFNIGIFPWFTLFASFLFFSPDWPLQFYNKFSRNASRNASRNDSRNTRGSGSQHNPPDSRLVKTSINSAVEEPANFKAKQTFIVAAMTIWLASQIIIPARNWFYPGNVAWTEDGHRFSWRMKLRSKSGSAIFLVHAADETWRVDPRPYLNAKQLRKMVCIPDLVWQFGQFLEEEWAEKGFSDVSVTVESECSLNGRNRQTFFRPDLDLTSVSRDELAVNWLVPLHEPLKNPLWTF